MADVFVETPLHEDAGPDTESSSSDGEPEEEPTTVPRDDLCGGFRLFSPRRALMSDGSGDNNEQNDQEEPLSACLAAWDVPRTPRSNTNSPRSPFPSSPSLAWLLGNATSTSPEATSDSSTSDESDPVAPATDLGRPRRVYVVTTAALPWSTGTAVNPILRAATLYEYYLKLATQSSDEQSTESSSMTNDNDLDTDASTPNTHSNDGGTNTDPELPSTALLDDDDGIFYDSWEDEQDVPSQYASSSSSPSPPTDWHVTLVIPWLAQAADRDTLYGTAQQFETPADQEAWMRNWLRETAGLSQAAKGLRIAWYEGRYYTDYRSIFPTQDLCALLPQLAFPGGTPTERYAPDCPVCIWEEPEHLLVYRAMPHDKTNESSNSSSAASATNTTTIPQNPLAGFYNVAVMHTNYKMYVAQGAFGVVSEMLIAGLFAVVTQAYTDRIIKLSATLQTYARHKETVSNVHGIRQDFLDIPPPTGNDIYYVGKLLWAKGLDRLLRLQRTFQRVTGHYFACTIFGNGPDEADMRTAFGRRPVTFSGRVDHAALPRRFKIFVNPSITEVLCTVRVCVCLFVWWFCCFHIYFNMVSLAALYRILISIAPLYTDDCRSTGHEQVCDSTRASLQYLFPRLSQCIVLQNSSGILFSFTACSGT